MSNLSKIIKHIREQKGLMQKEVASAADLQASIYSYLESGQREITKASLDIIALFFGLMVDSIFHYENPKKSTTVKIKDKMANEKIQLMSQLNEEDKHAVYRIIDGMLAKNKFQTFFEQNLQIAK
jgi:transcriptional regulator with XRE-family HTH domain